MKQLAQSSWLKPRVKVLASEDDGCALGVITELRMKPARLAASFAPMLGSEDGCALGVLLGSDGAAAWLR